MGWLSSSPQLKTLLKCRGGPNAGLCRFCLEQDSWYPKGGGVVHAWDSGGIRKIWWSWIQYFMYMLIFFLEKVLRAFYQLFKMIHDHTQKKHKKFMCLCNLWPWPLWRRRDGNEFCSAGQHQPSAGDTEWQTVALRPLSSQSMCHSAQGVFRLNTMRATQV